MTSIEIETAIQAPVELCFDLARDVAAHAESASFSAERVVPPGRTEGLLELGDLVAFEGRHFGVRQLFIARITEMDPPHRFVDEMVQGAFKSFRHVHEFQEAGDHTLMIDTLYWEAPFGPLGKLADRLFLRRHMTTFMRTKQDAFRRMAERRAGATGQSR